MDKVEAAARILATAEAVRRGDDIANPEGYIRSRTAAIARQHEATWRATLAADPTTTPEQLARPATPEDRTVAAQMRRIADNETRAAEDRATPPATAEQRQAAIDEARDARAKARDATDQTGDAA